MKKKNDKDTLTIMVDKLNTLALNLLDDIIQARAKNKVVDIESIKAPLLVIKEVKEVAKINAKIADSSFGSALSLDEDLENVEKLENTLGGIFDEN